MTSPPRAVLFDLDGTLLDTAPDMVAALNALRVLEGQPPLPFGHLRAWVSHGAAGLVKTAFPDAEEPRAADLRRRFVEIYRTRIAEETRLFAGMERVLDELRRRRLQAGVVTNKPGWLTEPLLKALDLEARFACVVSGDTVAERKPHPLPMLHAARLAGVEPGDCLYVGDAERDVVAAHAAGMTALVATYGYLGEQEDWSAWGGDGALARPEDLLAWIDGVPA